MGLISEDFDSHQVPILTTVKGWWEVDSSQDSDRIINIYDMFRKLGSQRHLQTQD